MTRVALLIRLCGLCLIAAVVVLTITYLRPRSGPIQKPPHWTVKWVAADGHHAVLARLDAIRGRNWAGKPYQLVLRCKDGTEPDAYVDWGSVISIRAPPNVNWQLDEASPTTRRWITSLDGGTTFVHDPRAFNYDFRCVASKGNDTSPSLISTTAITRWREGVQNFV